MTSAVYRISSCVLDVTLAGCTGKSVRFAASNRQAGRVSHSGGGQCGQTLYTLVDEISNLKFCNLTFFCPVTNDGLNARGARSRDVLPGLTTSQLSLGHVLTIVSKHNSRRETHASLPHSEFISREKEACHPKDEKRAKAYIDGPMLPFWSGTSAVIGPIAFHWVLIASSYLLLYFTNSL